MIERVGKEFPTLFICVRERVRPAPLEPKDGLVVGPAAASLRLSSALAVYGGLSRCAPRPLIRPPSSCHKGYFAPQPPCQALGAKRFLDRRQGVKKLRQHNLTYCS